MSTPMREALAAPLRELEVRLLLEPGRSIVGPAGVLLTSVFTKRRMMESAFWWSTPP